MKYGSVLTSVSLIITITACVIVSGCAQKQANDSQLSTDKYIFVEHFTQTRAEAVGHSDIDAYSYLGYGTYNNSTARLQAQQGVYFPEINDSLKVFFSNGTSIGPTGCHGGASVVYGVYELPFELDNLKIIKVDDSGTAFMEYGGESIVLAPKTNHTIVKSQLKDVRFTNGTVNETIQVNITVVDKISNYGICNKT